MFWNTIISTLSEAATVSSMTVLLLNSVAALLVSCIIFLSYRLTYSGTAFSKKFMVSLGMMTLVTTIIMNVISNNVALSLGMVGALSIIRFRTAVKDVRDATYIFWCIAVGVACGVSMYAQALVGSVVLLFFLVLCGQVRDEGRYLLVVRASAEAHARVKNAIDSFYRHSARLKAENLSGSRGDLIYEISAGSVKRSVARHGCSVCEELVRLDGVESADLVQQTDDISR